MGTKLYVGNLSFRTTSDELKDAFSAVGTVESASVIEDRETGRSRGFAFVEMATPEEAEGKALISPTFPSPILRLSHFIFWPPVLFLTLGVHRRARVQLRIPHRPSFHPAHKCNHKHCAPHCQLV